MKKIFNENEIWFVTGAQLLYGGDAVIAVDKHSNEMVKGLNIAGEAAIERLSQILYSPNPDFNINITASLISPEWVESETILNRNKISKKKSR